MAKEIKCVINDPKSGKSYSKTIDSSLLINRKIREIVPGNSIGLTGYELRICGGSDDAGFPMRPELDTAQRKRLLVKRSIGVRVKKKGMYQRKAVRGNTVSESTAQVNLSVSKYGTKTIQELLNPETKEETTSESKK
ncbi:MAG: S6e family ribosomal protein [Nanoarchaeota archaeon]|nr:S6e family ribosomal protein [Nanoarchaeota archaeon]